MSILLADYRYADEHPRDLEPLPVEPAPESLWHSWRLLWTDRREVLTGLLLLLLWAFAVPLFLIVFEEMNQWRFRS